MIRYPPAPPAGTPHLCVMNKEQTTQSAQHPVDTGPALTAVERRRTVTYPDAIRTARLPTGPGTSEECTLRFYLCFFIFPAVFIPAKNSINFCFYSNVSAIFIDI